MTGARKSRTYSVLEKLVFGDFSTKNNEYQHIHEQIQTNLNILVGVWNFFLRKLPIVVSYHTLRTFAMVNLASELATRPGLEEVENIPALHEKLLLDISQKGIINTLHKHDHDGMEITYRL